MVRPVTIFSGHWTDLSLEKAFKKFSSCGYDGVELACWPDHFSVPRAMNEKEYIPEIKKLLAKNHLTCFALAAHQTGKCVGDLWDPRINTFAPEELANSPEAIREWAIEEMKLTAQAAAAMGAAVVTGFLGSPVWRFAYAYPPVDRSTIEDGFRLIKNLWSPVFDVFDAAGIKFALEVHPSEIAFDYYSLKKTLELFEYRETLGINYNPSHLIWQGIQPELVIRDFPDRIYHVHIRDAAVTLDGRSGILGSHLDFGDPQRGWNFRRQLSGNSTEPAMKVRCQWPGKMRIWIAISVLKRPVNLRGGLIFHPVPAPAFPSGKMLTRPARQGEKHYDAGSFCGIYRFPQCGIITVSLRNQDGNSP